MLTRLIFTTAILVLLAAGSFAAEEEQKKAPPSFQPGAAVDMQITLKAPRQWKINYMMPLSFTFDAEYLKDAPFEVEEELLTVKLEQYVPYMTVVVPIKLKGKLPDGRLSVPLPVTFSICNEVTDFCAFSQETITIPVEVLAAAVEENKNSALKSGAVEHSHLLSIP